MLSAINNISISFKINQYICTRVEINEEENNLRIELMSSTETNGLICDEQQARERRTKWFEAAKASGIEPLAKFARIKEKRIEGLIYHASHPISTGKLEGLNNKTKVAKRIGYGYRDNYYFFTLIKYISLPSVRLKSHNYP